MNQEVPLLFFPHDMRRHGLGSRAGIHTDDHDANQFLFEEILKVPF